MKLLVFILHNDELLDDLLQSFLDAKIKGATILDSMGMVGALTSSGKSDIPLFGSLKLMLNQGNPSNKTIFVALEDDQVDDCIKCIKNVVGSLQKSNSGILFTLPIDYLEGFPKELEE